jgi:dolichol-phosphate mannosyltransferase
MIEQTTSQIIPDSDGYMNPGECMQEKTSNPKVLVAVFCFNENVKIERTLSRFPAERCYDLIVMNDGSNDDSVKRIKKFPDVGIVSHSENRGAGASIRTVHQYALNKGYDVLALVAGNDKDDPLQIPRLIKPIMEHGYDYIQGSRYLMGGSYGKMPVYRVIASKYVHPLLFSLITRRRITDSTNGFRAHRTSLLRDNRINLDQDWLNKYELEPYFFYKVIKSGYKVKEVPVSKIYPPKDLGYTKMRPILGWWSILKPLLFLGLGLRK